MMPYRVFADGLSIECDTPEEAIQLKRILASINEPADRTPISQRKETLVAFLGANGPKSRKQIKQETDIPEGSISCLLKYPDFVQVSHGVWKLTETNGRAEATPEEMANAETEEG